ncbi:MAG: hypothetical protein CMD85_00575 [Gammaproteobacteria bacterium]|nr:hypothetical protein [Gammaproteobacteria bacterium]|tara:strand:+ start:16940 stop:18385 length:1446 start_codon:yes stop_codon:yes gene_type:complete
MKKNTKIQPVILCGGEGLRLWPISRKSMPKQFYDLLGSGESNLSFILKLVDKPAFEDPIIVSNIKLRALLKKELFRIYPKRKFTVLLEPTVKSTAPALSATINYFDSINIDKDQTLAFLPSDHLFSKGSSLIRELNALVKEGIGEEITLIGVKPEYAEVDYGYIKFKNSKNKLKEVERFVEKPKLGMAKRFIKDKRFLWNTGIFIGKQITFMNLLEKFYKNHDMVRKAVMDSSIKTEGRVSYILLSKEFFKVSNDSFDKSILEKTSEIKVLPANIAWRDLGSWKSIYNSLKKDKNNNSFFGTDIHSHAVSNSLVYQSELPKKKEILISDISNLAVVDTEDALLVTSLDSSLDFKEILNKSNIKNKDTTSLFHRPWGNYTNLLSEPNVLVKQITVYPRSSMSLQRHFHRSEHWTVLSGKAYVTVGNERKLYKKNQSVFIERKTKHRLENPFKKPVEMIEVQIGDKISEEDIERFDDLYDRME